MLCLLATGCARQGRVSDNYDEDFYTIDAKLNPGVHEGNPEFLVIGDNRPGWRAAEKFARRHAWATWWQLAIPFYQLYWLGNGFVGGVNYMRHVPDWGEEEARRVRDDVYAMAQQTGADFVVHLGDIATDGRRPRHWETFVKQYKHEVPLAAEYPMLPIIGNHERANDTINALPNFEAVFNYPRFYRVTWDDIDMFFVDSDLIMDQYGFIDDDDQDRLFEEWFVSGDNSRPAWLERELASSDRRFRIVFMHHPPIAFGKHHGNWDDPSNGRNLRAKRLELLKLFQHSGVNAVFSGHQHMYERSVVAPIAGVSGAKELQMVISGGAGSPLHYETSDAVRSEYAADYARDGLSVECRAQKSIFNYCRVAVSNGSVAIEVHEVTKNADESGRVVDSFSIE